MRRERGPRLDMEPVEGSGMGVGEERAGGEGGERTSDGSQIFAREGGHGLFSNRPAELRRRDQSWEGLA